MIIIFRSGLHLILCYYALEDTEKIKHAFTLLLDVPLDVDIEEEKYRITSVSFINLFLKYTGIFNPNELYRTMLKIF